MTLEMVKADVDAAAEKVGAAADGIHATKPGPHLAGVSAAMAGSQSAGAAKSLTESWETGVSDLYRDLAALRDQMVSAANHLQAQDEVVRRAFRPMAGVQ
jgi:hypothetical protein